MTDDEALGRLDLDLARQFADLGAEVRRRVRDLDGLAALRTREDGDVTHDFDRMAENRIFEVLDRSGLGMRISSEESAEFSVGSGDRYLAIIDPIDGSDMVAHGYPLASIAFSLVDAERGIPVYSRIHEIFTESDFVARGSIASRNGATAQPSAVSTLDDAFVVSYSPTPARRTSGAHRRLLESRAALILNYGGPLDVAKVGSGQCDAVVELAKGFPPRDLLPGLHFATLAGAVACDEKGNDLAWSFARDDRQRFVVAANRHLLVGVLESL
ncbi:inositol monophosphatase family protein [Actinoplanes sp. NPDC051851]|uniref:inositol monophosphatase family protein n=1 Tax=Actinoplanes sp. NPDC051851 TaxID=3154753 RepID=UPI00343B10FC